MSDLFTEPPGEEVESGWRALLAGDPDAGGHVALAALYGPLVAPLPPERAYVIGQSGQSLDGYIASRAGHSHYVTGPESLLHLHRLRALVDAVVVGAATVESDDPRLSVRRCEGRDPARVVVDTSGRTPMTHRVFRADGDVVRLVGSGASRGPTDVEVDRDGRGLSPVAMVAALAERGHRRILVEGGGRLVSSFLRAGELDRLHIVIAPLLIGGGVSGPQPAAVDHLEDALRPPAAVHRMGSDVLFDLRLDDRRR